MTRAGLWLGLWFGVPLAALLWVIVFHIAHIAIPPEALYTAAGVYGFTVVLVTMSSMGKVSSGNRANTASVKADYVVPQYQSRASTTWQSSSTTTRQKRRKPKKPVANGKSV